jgi:hypothetical protein
MLLEPLIVLNGDHWLAFAKLLQRANKFPNSFDAHLSITSYIGNLITETSLRELLLKHSKKSFQLAPDSFSRQDQAKIYFDLLLSQGDLEEAQAFKEVFKSVPSNVEPIKFSEWDKEVEEDKKWQPLADLIAVYCFDAYLTLIESDTNCQKALSIANDRSDIKLDPSWTNKAYKTLEKHGFSPAAADR